MLKRIFDTLTSLLGLLILAPVFALVGVAIKRDSPGPVFFAGERIGRGGQPFKSRMVCIPTDRSEAHHGARIMALDGVLIKQLGEDRG